jgi:uncharacterized membrane protein
LLISSRSRDSARLAGRHVPYAHRGLAGGAGHLSVRIGSHGCHQRPDRSFAVAGNQFPVYKRGLAIELGMAGSFAAAVLVAPLGGFIASLSVFPPERLRSRAGTLAAGLVLMLSMSLDGGLQLVTARVSARTASSSGSPPGSSSRSESLMPLRAR